jgi:hypothetical protein
MWLIGPDTGIKTINAERFNIDHVVMDGAHSFGAQLQWVKGSGDSVLMNSIFVVFNDGAHRCAVWRRHSHHEQQDQQRKCWHRGILNLVTSPAVSLMFISNNRIEGTSIGIQFQRLAGVTESVGNL